MEATIFSSLFKTRKNFLSKKIFYSIEGEKIK